MSQRIPIVIFGLLVVVLIIGQRFDFSWAGGNGYNPDLQVEIVAMGGDVRIDRNGSVRDAALGDRIRRGEVIKTDNGKVMIKIGNETLLALDERTDITIDKIKDQEIVVRFPRGRILVEHNAPGSFRVITNYHESLLQVGTASFVNYDFRETVSVIPIDTSVQVYTEHDGAIAETQVPIDVHETQPVERANFVFKIDEGTGADFYTWANAMIPTAK